MGWSAATGLALAGRTTRARRVRRLHLRGYRYPLFVRNGSSDARVARQVFVEREYACVAARPGVEYIVDCGANVGFTSFYLLHHYPAARAVVVEPDAGNMAMCRMNLAPFTERVTFVTAGVWGTSVPMIVVRGTFRDGAEWSYQVRPSRPGEAPDFDARTVPDLLAVGGFPRADVLKMDIEAAEEDVFRAGAGDWLPRVRDLVIEFHGPACRQAVDDALVGYDHQIEWSGELAVIHLQSGPAPLPSAQRGQKR